MSVYAADNDPSEEGVIEMEGGFHENADEFWESTPASPFANVTVRGKI